MLTAPAVLPAQPTRAGCPRAALPAYAHNDYANARPLDDALALGFRGVEADLFLVLGELRLGHDRREAKRGATLEATYLAPLQALVARCGTLTEDGRPFLLAVELKERSRPAFDSLLAALARHPEMFSPSDAPPVEIVLVGWTPAALTGLPVPMGRQVLLRAPDGRAPAATDPSVRLIGLDYHKTMGRWWTTSARRRRWLSSMRAVRAASPAQRLRAFHVPVNARVYRALQAAGVDLIGTRDLARTARLLGAPRSGPGRSLGGELDSSSAEGPARPSIPKHGPGRG
jgi:hypothetical protein